MMTEEAKMILYAQMEKMSTYNTNGDAEIKSFEEFSLLTEPEILKCVFDYKDNNSFEFYGEKYQPQIELPSMDLSGQDLREVYLSDFTPYATNYGMSNINLENTNCVINLSRVVPIEQNIDEIDVTTLEQCNFKGCRVFGRLPKEVKSGENTYTDEYIERIKIWEKQKNEQKIAAEKIYESMLKGISLKSLSGIIPCSLSDYDLTNIDLDVKREDGQTYREYLNKKEVSYDYTGAYIHKMINGSLGVEESTPEKMKFNALKLACKNGNSDLIGTYFDEISESERKYIVAEACKNGDKKFLESHFDEISNQYINIAVKNWEGIFKAKCIKYISKMEEFSASQTEQIEYQKRSRNGELLYNAISTEADIEVIKELVKATISEQKKLEQKKTHENPEGLDYRKYNENKKDYTPILYEALLSKSIYSEPIINLLLNNGVDIDNKYVSLKRSFGNTQAVEEKSCAEVNNGKLKKIFWKRENNKSKSNQQVTPTIINEADEINKDSQLPNKTTVQPNDKEREKEVIEFFREVIHLDEGEIDNLISDEYVWRRLSKARVEEDLSLKKIIFDNYNLTKGICEQHPCLWTYNIKIIYAKLKYFSNDLKIPLIAGDKLTLGSSRVFFANRYGERIVKREGKEGEEYAKAVEDALCKIHPMSENKKELERELRDVQKKIVEHGRDKRSSHREIQGDMVMQ